MNESFSDRRGAPFGRALAPAVLAVAAFLLAYASPVEDVGADPAIALLSTQAFLDHGTWRLDPFRGDPRCAYDLERDYRIRPHEGHSAYYNLSVPVLSLPAVWLANRFGVHMLDQASEFALQNLLSALCCALVATALYFLCRRFLAPAASFAMTAVTVFGSSLTSTLATGLWNLDYAVALLALALLYLVRHWPEDDDPAAFGAPRWGLLALLAAAAFFCRPTAGFAILAAVLAFGVPGTRRTGRRLWIGAAGLAVVLAGLLALSLMPEGHYYTPRKLVPRTPPWIGLYGVLLSPSRGLLIFSPFLIPVVLGAIVRWRSLWRRRLFRFASLWIGLHLLAVSVREVWWGGHSYGPRLLTELALPAIVVACLLWRDLEGARSGARPALAAAFLVLGAAAVAIHSGQGLFNPAVQRWNVSPDVDAYPGGLLDWRWPQFLASESSVAGRLEAHRRRGLLPYRFGEAVEPGGRNALFRSWQASEGAWRWSAGAASEVVLDVGDQAVDPGGTYLLEVDAGAHGLQTVTVTVNGARVDRFVARGFAPERRLSAFPGRVLAGGTDLVVRFEVPGAAPAAGDPRVLGLALRSLRVLRLPSDFAGVAFDDDLFFAEGWSASEDGWRWTDGTRASILYPVATVGRDVAALEVLAGSLGEQRVELRLDGTPIGEMHFGGPSPVSRRLVFDAGLLEPSTVHRVELAIPGARRTGADPRLLGVSLVRLAIHGERASPRD